VSAVELTNLDAQVDSVYFLMFPGWESELRSNRWHYARRWARHRPVVLVQPVRNVLQAAESRPETRIPNAEILSIAATSPTDFLNRSLLQADQLFDHMDSRSHTRPLLWCYNPNLAGAYAALPATARIFHATENYFDFEGLPQFFLARTSLAFALSDLIVAVSPGVAASAAHHGAPERIRVVSNGCDTAHYKPTGERDSELVAAGSGYKRVAIYAGNVNDRLDFALLNRVAGAHGDTLFAVYGPVADLPPVDRDAWESFRRRQNAHTSGPVAPDRLPALYRAANVGIIPYKQTPWLVRNGFPLKALEMGATGLPMVTSRMESLRGLASALVVADDDDAFVEALGFIGRSALRENDELELAAVCAANDYDLKFAEVVAQSSDLLSREAVSTRVDALIEHCGSAAWREACAARRCTAAYVLRVLAAQLYSGVGQALPARLRRAIPESVRTKVRARFVI
jgi:glycosyltransferase involved in cell wall biosynthesis